MLKYGPQGFQDARLILPRNPALHPNREFVEERYGMFRKAKYLLPPDSSINNDRNGMNRPIFVALLTRL